jgi:hypothetical protein
MDKQTIFTGRKQILENLLELKQWATRSSTKRMGNISSAFEKADIQWNKYSSAA